MHAIIGQKKGQTQKFLTNGQRVPVTVVEVKDNPVVTVKTLDRDGYISVQLGYGMKKHATKAALGHAKKGANLDKAPYLLQEIRFASDANIDELPKAGDMVSVAAVLEAGDIIDVTGTSKGKGFAGVVKRHHFKGGPRTHGQSDRERAPGSIGQTTTPGRVYRGKRMAGKMGFETVTIKNVEVIDVTADGIVWVKGVFPGVAGSIITLTKTGKKKKNFVSVVKEEVKVEPTVEVVAQAAVPETKQEEVAA
jgi:large subunit ribosomal protein L3